MTEVLVQDIPRPQLEQMVLLYHGFARRLLEAVRENAKPDWKVRKDVEEIASHYTPLLEIRIAKANATELERLVLERQVARHDRVWEQHR